MDLTINIQKKPKKTDGRKITTTEDVYNLEEIQAIKDSIQEHFIFIGLDRGNHIRNFTLLGIGTSYSVLVDSKQVVRTALLSASDRVVLVHNHPSNQLKASREDIRVSNTTSKLLEAFNIELLDHIIVTEDGFLSMEKTKSFDRSYTDDSLRILDKAFLMEENMRLKQDLEQLKEQFYNKEVMLEEDDEEEDEEI